MSFSGKRYKRVSSENVDELIRASNSNENLIQMLKSNAPVFSFTRIDDKTFDFRLEIPDKVMSHKIVLGEEVEMSRRDGSKVKIVYTLESDNVLKQEITPREGKKAFFRREFYEKGGKMTIQVDGTDIIATVYYDQID
ncbi:fatty acid-binding protein-like [Trichoplusia ni]|uniref:Fatty acid-binding protein-like n=1 Tax=Trichoplusia ni TaxID=7111 RepID=A0A7E5VN67_TRINI|nr:fatty acid-binding protein-like [Trichoplusia ni]